MQCAARMLREIRGLFADENILPVGRMLRQIPEAGIVLYAGHEDIPELPLGAAVSDHIVIPGLIDIQRRLWRV